MVCYDGIKWGYCIGNEMKDLINKIHHADCMDIMKDLPDKCIDLAIVDPPYGINKCKQKSYGLRAGMNYVSTKYIPKKWDEQIPTKKYFKELFRISKNQIIWGGNYFNLLPTRCFIIWDKKQPEGVSFAMAEYAWSSFNKVAKALELEFVEIYPEWRAQIASDLSMYEGELDE